MGQFEFEFSSNMKEQLKENIIHIKGKMDDILESLDQRDECTLCKFEEIQKKLFEIQSTAASYYLKAYLSPFTDSYIVITTAIQHLSSKRHGALIVVERNDPVNPLIHPGTPIGGALSFSLIESIFYPGSPLHDGALLVQGNQIVSAANVLPLSQSFYGERKLGTRHRAALGLSEMSDALILVVSEETGRTSFALDGTLYLFTPSYDM
ncbi:sporulation-specific diadenylate cyclase CdaS [Fictibacillus sp. Mic-4]|uniref:sporulation-specific diadenylate cyclase CdaS n=1 Tax=Fictibacillus sp. Mic-4 TaxID=3132826 RepID=UPI003CF30BA4